MTATLSLPDRRSEVLALEARLAGTTIAVRVAGTADAETRSQLAAYVAQLHAEATRLGVAQVELDVQALEFMNSSCLKILVAWLADVRDLAPAAQYRVRFRSNPNLLWQQRSLDALSCFAADLVTVEAGG